MTAEELLKPRFEVIADYPNYIFDVGEIIETERAYRPVSFAKNLEEFPHLFRKLNWWKHRKEEDMPKRIKLFFSDREEIFEISGYEMDDMIAWTNDQGQGLSLPKLKIKSIPID